MAVHPDHMLYAVEGDGPCLLGRDWLQNIQVSIKAVYRSKGQSKVEALINQFQNVFESGLDTMKSFQAHLYMKDEVKPTFCRPRSVPFAIKDGVGKELDRLEEAGIVIKLDYSE